MGERTVEHGARYIVWTFTEDEFRQALGITDGNGIVVVSRDFTGWPMRLKVYLSPDGQEHEREDQSP